MPDLGRRWVDRRGAVALAGDALVFLIFAWFGRRAHAMDAGGGVSIVQTAAPFLLSWLVIAGLSRMFTNGALARPGTAAGRAVGTWLAAGVVGLVARSAVLQRPLILSFAVVVLGLHAVLLGLWRGGLSWYLSRRDRGA